MSRQKAKPYLLRNAYQHTWLSFKDNPVLFTPFIIFALTEFLALILLFLIPRYPFVSVFGPPIRTFCGEAFLHYPVNFMLLPKLASLLRMFLSVVMGSLLTGAAVIIVFHIYNKEQLRLRASFGLAFRKYIGLFGITFILTALFYFISKAITVNLTHYFLLGHKRLLFISAGIWMGPLSLCISLALAMLIQSAFTYAIPFLVIENETIFRSIKKSFSLFRKFFIPTIILVGLPMLVYLPVLVLNYNTGFLINKLFPEITLLVLFLSIIVNSLIIDPLISVSTTYLYLLSKENR